MHQSICTQKRNALLFLPLKAFIRLLSLQQFVVIAFLVFNLGPAKAQNLVPNGDFENFISCPTAPSQIGYATPWNGLQNHVGTSDYFNVCATDTQVQVPKNIYGTQAAASGSGYAGITLIINTLSPEYREYLATQLTTPFVAGKKYLFSLKYSLADACRRATNNLGVYFSTTKPSGNNTWDPAGFIPQLKVPKILNDKANWDSIGMVYTATGGEKYIVIGNFDSSTQTNQVSVANGTWFNGAYVFIDDVSLKKLPGGLEISQQDTIICVGDSVILYASGSSSYAWATTQLPGTVFSVDSVVTVRPSVTTTYVVYGDADTGFITVTIRQLPAVYLGQDTSLCDGQSIVLNAIGSGNSYAWQDGSSDPIFIVDTSGKYWVRVIKDGCVNSDTISIRYFPYPQADLGSDQYLCSGRSLVLKAMPDQASYVWNTGSTSQSVEITQTGVYWVHVTANGCSDTDTMVVISQSEGCDCIATAPTAFTPNNDQQNDLFRIVHFADVTLEKFLVFNRWGEVVFSTTDITKGWDGFYKGERAEQGTYFYYFEYFCARDQDNYRVKGDVLLLR